MANVRIGLAGAGRVPAMKMPAMPGAAPVHMASRISGATGLHSYLGHFAAQQYLRAGHNTSGHWEQSAVKHPGVEKRAAARAGESTHAYMESKKNAPGTAGKRARLGLTFERQAEGR